MDDHIIRIGTVCNGHWNMVIDLKELAASAGVRKKEPDGIYKDPKTGETEVYKGSYYTDYAMTKAKKLLKLIWQYGRPEDFGKVDTYLEPNAKLHKYWRELCRI